MFVYFYSGLFTHHVFRRFLSESQTSSCRCYIYVSLVSVADILCHPVSLLSRNVAMLDGWWAYFVDARVLRKLSASTLTLLWNIERITLLIKAQYHVPFDICMCVFIISACKQHNSLCTVLIVANICDLYTFIYKAASAAAACTVYEMAQDRQLLARYCLWFLSQEIVCLLLLSCLFTACFTNCVSLLHGSLTTLFLFVS